MLQLPIQADAYYIESFLSPAQAAAVFDEVISSFDVHDKSILMADGRTFEAETATHFFVDEALLSFEKLHSSWGSRCVWTPLLADVRKEIESVTGASFQVARCVYYRDGSEGVAFHSDPPAYGPTDEIASLSLGEERKFVLREKTGEQAEYPLRLANGSLLFMGRGVQEQYEHALPYDSTCSGPRVNLTFRKFEG